MCAQTSNEPPESKHPTVIETEEEIERMLKVIEGLMDKGENLTLEEENHLRSLAKLVEDFEERYYRS